jgi:hypothetical protein
LTVPIDALTRYSISDGENGPPWGPEKAMLVDGVTINDGGDCPAGLCAAPICVNSNITGTASKAIDAIWLVAIMLNQPASRGGGADVSMFSYKKNLRAEFLFLR